MAELINIKKGETWNDVEFNIDTNMIGGFYFFVGSYNTTNRIQFRKENNRYVFYQMKGNVPTKDVLINVSHMANPTEPLFENIPVSTFISKPIIATATSTVSNGKSSTSVLTYSQGHSRSDLIPGNTYQINGAYQENDHYGYAEGIGTLEMLKCNTTTTLSGDSQISVWENLTITAIVKENNGNTSLSRGSLKLYDGNSLVQTIPVTNTTTSISYHSEVAGTHDLYVIYEDSGTEYNTSTSNHLIVEVTKIDMEFADVSIALEGDESFVDEGAISGKVGFQFTISGYLGTNLNDEFYGVSDLSIKFYDYNGSLLDTIVTDENGYFETSYVLSSEMANAQSISLEYEGSNIYKEASRDIPVYVIPNTQLYSIVEQISDLETGYTLLDNSGLSLENCSHVVHLPAHRNYSIEGILTDENGNAMEDVEVQLVIDDEVTADSMGTGNDGLFTLVYTPVHEVEHIKICPINPESGEVEGEFYLESITAYVPQFVGINVSLTAAYNTTRRQPNRLTPITEYMMENKEEDPSSLFNEIDGVSYGVMFYEAISDTTYPGEKILTKPLSQTGVYDSSEGIYGEYYILCLVYPEYVTEDTGNYLAFCKVNVPEINEPRRISYEQWLFNDDAMTAIYFELDNGSLPSEFENELTDLGYI